jgi:REP element-mobilizing transposase RayT
MPRLGRLHIPGGCYHVMGRGLERRRIFNADVDKQDFLFRLGEILERCGSLCLAWSVMSNHYHLLIRVGDQPLAKLMLPLLGGYAGCYNRRHHRSGYVFQNRYKSILCDEDS